MILFFNGYEVFAQNDSQSNFGARSSPQARKKTKKKRFLTLDLLLSFFHVIFIFATPESQSG